MKIKLPCLKNFFFKKKFKFLSSTCFFLSLGLILLFLVFPVLALAQKRSGIHIGTRYSEADRAIAGVGSGGWIVVIAGGTGDCEALQEIISKAESAGVNVVVRGHLNNYLTPPDALGWTATLGSLNISQKLYFMPWNEPNQTGSADWGDPEDVAAYTAALKQHFAASGIGSKVGLLSPMLNQTWVGGAGDFDNYVGSLKSIDNNYFSSFDGIALNLYDLSQQICGSALCADDPHFNPAKFSDLLNIMGAAGKPAFGVESGTAGQNFYWKEDPAVGSPLYNFTKKFLQTSHPAMFALPAYDLAGEVGHTWDLFTPPDTVNLLGAEPGGGTAPASFDQAKFQAWLQPLLDSGELISCGNSCGFAPASNPGLCTATGEPVSGLTETSLTECILIDKVGGQAAEDSSPVYISEAVTYTSSEDGTSPAGEENRCFDVFWTAKLQLVEETLELPFVYYLNQYFLGAIDIHRVPPEILDPLQLGLRNALEITGPINKLAPQQIQDKLKNDFLEETIKRIDQSRLEGEPKTAYISEDLSQVFTIGSWDLEQIYYQHNVYKMRQKYYECLKQKQAKDCHHLIASIDEQALAVWQLVPFFPNEMTEGKVEFSAVDMEFDPNPLKTKVPELYRLNKITKFFQDLLVPQTSSSYGIPSEGGTFGHGKGLWQPQDDGSICYNASAQEHDKKESLYLLEQDLASSNYEAGVTLNFGTSTAKMGLWFRVSIDEEIQASHPKGSFAGVKGYGFMISRGSAGGYKAELWKTTPPDYILDNPDLIENQSLGDLNGRLDVGIKIRAVNDHIQTFVDLNGNGVIEEDAELMFDVYDDDFPVGGLGFKIYNPGNDNPCFTDYEFSYSNQANLNKQNQKIADFDPFKQIKNTLINKTASFYEKLMPDKLKNVLASSKLVQPLKNLIAQAEQEPCFHIGAEVYPVPTAGGVNANMSVKLYSDGKDGHFWFSVNNVEQMVAQPWHAGVDPVYSIPSQYTPSIFVPIGESRKVTYGARLDSCWNQYQEITCILTVDSKGNFSTNCSQGAPVFPGECWTPASEAILPDPEAIYDEENYTPDICLKESITDIEGERSVQNRCQYKVDPLTGALTPQTCTNDYISAINVKNTAPWLETIYRQTLNIASGLFRIWNPQTLYNEDSLENPFRPVPAKDQVGYAYSHTGGDPRIKTSMLPGPWDLLFAYLGGVVNTKDWLTDGFLNPLKGMSQTYPQTGRPSKPALPLPPEEPGQPEPPKPPAVSPSPEPYKPISPPPAAVLNPPSTSVPGFGAGECASPYAYVVNNADSRNYVYDGYKGGFEQTEDSAHSDMPYLAVMVEWPDKNVKFVFSQETGANTPYFEFSDSSGVKFYHFNSQTGEDLYNHYGRLTENSKVEILQNNSEKVLIQWQYWNTNKNTGEKINHVVEFYTFYPCGFVTKEARVLELIKPSAYSTEPVMISLVNPVSSRWYKHIVKQEDWYHTLSLQDLYSDNKHEFWAKPVENELNSSETREEGEEISLLKQSQGKVITVNLKKGRVFLAYGDRSGLENENILDVGKSSGHACFNSSLIGWTNNEWEKCTSDNFTVYPNETPLLKISHEPENSEGGQHHFSFMGIAGSLTDEELKNLVKDWLENNSFFTE
jgi:hypothetical protein